MGFFLSHKHWLQENFGVESGGFGQPPATNPKFCFGFQVLSFYPSTTQPISLFLHSHAEFNWGKFWETWFNPEKFRGKQAHKVRTHRMHSTHRKWNHKSSHVCQEFEISKLSFIILGVVFFLEKLIGDANQKHFARNSHYFGVSGISKKVGKSNKPEPRLTFPPSGPPVEWRSKDALADHWSGCCYQGSSGHRWSGWGSGPGVNSKRQAHRMFVQKDSRRSLTGWPCRDKFPDKCLLFGRFAGNEKKKLKLFTMPLEAPLENNNKA